MKLLVPHKQEDAIPTFWGVARVDWYMFIFYIAPFPLNFLVRLWDWAIEKAIGRPRRPEELETVYQKGYQAGWLIGRQVGYQDGYERRSQARIY